MIGAGLGEGFFEMVANPGQGDELFFLVEFCVDGEQDVLDDGSRFQRLDFQRDQQVLPSTRPQEFGGKGDGWGQHFGHDVALVTGDGDEFIALTGKSGSSRSLSARLLAGCAKLSSDSLPAKN